MLYPVAQIVPILDSPNKQKIILWLQEQKAGISGANPIKIFKPQDKFTNAS